MKRLRLACDTDRRLAVGFRTYSFASDDYAQACELRLQILRLPLGLRLTAADVAGEAEQLHFGWFDSEGKLVACVMVVPLDGTTGKLRQMAVASSHQGTGIGRMLLNQVHQHLRGRGYQRLILHSRITAVGFYTKLGYAASGNEFTEVGIPHLCMEMMLPVATA